MNKELTYLNNLTKQFELIEAALLKAKLEGKKTINLKEELKLCTKKKKAMPNGNK